MKCQAGGITSWNQNCQENINNLRYADDNILMAENEEELKSLLKRSKEENERDGLKLNIQKAMIVASGPITSWQIEEAKVEAVAAPATPRLRLPGRRPGSRARRVEGRSAPGKRAVSSGDC